jgi:hypothetical protein
VLACFGWYWEWEHGCDADNDSGDCQGEEIPESSVPASAVGFQFRGCYWDWLLEDVWQIPLSTCRGCLGQQEFGICPRIRKELLG